MIEIAFILNIIDVEASGTNERFLTSWNYVFGRIVGWAEAEGGGEKVKISDALIVETDSRLYGDEMISGGKEEGARIMISLSIGIEGFHGISGTVCIRVTGIGDKIGESQEYAIIINIKLITGAETIDHVEDHGFESIYLEGLGTGHSTIGTKSKLIVTRVW